MSGWFALKAGAIGTIAVGIAGYFGHAAIQIASAPRDTVAYDFIQSATGLLKREEAKPAPETSPEPSAEPTRLAAAPRETPAAPASMQAEPSPPPLAEPKNAPMAAETAPQASGPSTAVARPDPALDKAARGARETAEMAASLTARTMATRGAKLVGVRHDETASLCGGRYGVEVYPVSRAVVLKPDQSATFIRLGVGQSRDLAPGCRVALKATKETGVAEADLEQTDGT
ncbi:hypothetical protein ACFOWB_04115 [Chenggangzhangella methanolivorans]